MKKIKITEQQARLLGLKPKNVIKITKEQYDRIFANGVIKEEVNSIDSSYRKTFAGKDIQNLKPSVQSESDFDIKKLNSSIAASAQGRFGQDMVENEGGNDGEVKELIAYLYRKTDEFPPSLVDKGLTFDEICDALLSKNIIIDDNGKFLLSKSLGSPENAIKAVQDELNALTGGAIEEPMEEPELETEDVGDYPTGADMDPRAPYNQNPKYTKPIIPKNKIFEPVAMNNEIAILKNKEGELFVFYYYDLDKDDLRPYSEVEVSVNGSEDGLPNYDYSDEFDIDGYLISNYVNDNINKLKMGVGLGDYENGADLVKIDEPLKQDLLSLYDKDKEIASALDDINEGADAIEKFKSDTKKAFTPDPSKAEKSPEELQKIKDRLADIRAKELERRKAQDSVEETTSAASSGSFTGPLSGPMVNREMPDDVNHLNVPVVKEFELGKGYTHFAIDKDTSKIVNGWDYKGIDKEDIKHYATIDLKDEFPEKKLSSFKIVTRKSLMNNGINPNDTNNWGKNGETELMEMTSGSGSMGAYDANALPGIKRDGSFKEVKPTKAQKNTQYAGGSFVEMGDCTKMNNKPAGSGCSQGAVDNVVKLKQTGSNVNAPSLGGGK